MLKRVEGRLRTAGAEQTKRRPVTGQPGRRLANAPMADLAPKAPRQTQGKSRRQARGKSRRQARGKLEGLDRLGSPAHFLRLLLQAQILIQGSDVPMQLGEQVSELGLLHHQIRFQR